MDVRRRDERVDARRVDALQRLDGGVDVLVVGAGQRRDDAADRAAHLADALDLAWRRDREARLYDVDPEPLELARDLHLLASVERDAGRLLAVTQRGVEDPDGVRCG